MYVRVHTQLDIRFAAPSYPRRVTYSLDVAPCCGRRRRRHEGGGGGGGEHVDKDFLQVPGACIVQRAPPPHNYASHIRLDSHRCEARKLEARVNITQREGKGFLLTPRIFAWTPL